MSLAALAACLMAGAAAAAAGDAGDRAPVCRWTFDGSLDDPAGEARDRLAARDGRGGEAVARFVTPAELPGVSGKAVALGVRPDDAAYLTAPVSGDVTLGPSYSMAAWIHPTSAGAWGRLALRWGNAPKYAYHLALHEGRASLCHGQADGKLVFAEGGRAVPGQWHHLAAVARRNDAHPAQSELIVYLDGRRVGAAAWDGTTCGAGGEPLGIGDSAGAPSADCRFRGYLDELTLWNRPLEPAEVAAQYAARGPALRELETARRKESFDRLQGLGVEEIVFAERSPGRDPAGHYYANFGYACTDPDYWIHGADGGRLLKLNLRTGDLAALVDDPQGAVRDPQVHYDGRRVLFSYRKGGTHHYNLYEIGADGAGLRQITRGPWDDVEPAWLPDGDLVFCSTRCKRYIGCWLAPSAVLHRCGPSGERLRMISSGAFTENTPAVLPDGRLLYTRWEYVNRDPVSFHHLWTMDPDGAGAMVFFGNMHPGGVLIDAQPAPGTGRVVLVHSPDHGRNEHAGRLAALDPKRGPDARASLAPLAAGDGFRDPFPLAADVLLAAEGNRIVLVDAQGAVHTLFSGPLMVHEPRPLGPRPREAVLPSRTDAAQPAATLVLGDVYAGRAMSGVRRGAVKKLLVLEDLPKPANYHGGGSQPIGHGVTSTLKRILGTVPVEADGSAALEVPPLRSLYFAALDEHDRSIKQMRSFVTLQPGETAGCVGCHEPRTRTPAALPGKPLAALSRPPSRIEPVPGVPEILDFPRDVQPVLDRHCVRCHNPDRPLGGVSLAGDRGPVFSHSYYELFLHWQIKDTGGPPMHGSGRQPGADSPYTTYSSASPLMEKIAGVPGPAPGPAAAPAANGAAARCLSAPLPPAEAAVVRLWIDSGAAYAGTYAALGTGQVGGCWGNNEPVRVMADDWPSTAPAQDAVQRRCAACHPKEQLPQHVTARTTIDPWGDMLSWTRPLSRYSRHRIFNLSRPEKSLALLVPLSKAAGGYAEGPAPGADAALRPVAEDRARPPRPAMHPAVFASTGDPDYRAILAHVGAAARKLDEIKRFDMPGFRPSGHYVREMQRFGVLPETFDTGSGTLDVYATDRAYWQSFWHRPSPADRRETVEK